jgi:hypothetical protein
MPGCSWHKLSPEVVFLYYEELKNLLADALANGRRLSDEAFVALCRLCLRAAKEEGRLGDAVESFPGVFEVILRLD